MKEEQKTRKERLWERTPEDIKKELTEWKKGEKFTHELSDRALSILEDLEMYE